jgi:hypothetical protein
MQKQKSETKREIDNLDSLRKHVVEPVAETLSRSWGDGRHVSAEEFLPHPPQNVNLGDVLFFLTSSCVRKACKKDTLLCIEVYWQNWVDQFNDFSGRNINAC